MGAGEAASQLSKAYASIAPRRGSHRRLVDKLPTRPGQLHLPFSDASPHASEGCCSCWVRGATLSSAIPISRCLLVGPWSADGPARSQLTDSSRLSYSFMLVNPRRKAGKQRLIFWFNGGELTPDASSRASLLETDHFGIGFVYRQGLAARPLTAR